MVVKNNSMRVFQLKPYKKWTHVIKQYKHHQRRARMENKILIGIIELNEAKKIALELTEHGIKIDFDNNSQTCRRGCQPTVELWANSEDMPKIEKLLSEKRMQILKNEGNEINSDILGSVYDQNSDIAVCPACGTSFSTKEKECPECGLVFIPD